MRDTKWHFLSNDDWPTTGMVVYLVAYLDEFDVRRVREASYRMSQGYFYNDGLGRLELYSIKQRPYAWREMPEPAEYK